MTSHPILRDRSTFLIYSFAWVTITFIQIIALVQLFDFNWIYASIDGLTYGVLFFMFGMGMWFFIRFTDFRKNKALSLFIEHGSYLLIIVSVWVIGGIYILTALFSGIEEIESFLWESITWRYLNGFLLFIVLLLFYYLNSYYSNIQSQQKKENELIKTLKDTEINLLRSKLNPHFLFNSLNSLYALIELKPEKASQMMLELSDYLRFSLNQDFKKMISLQEEMQNLKRYLNIEKMRFDDKIKFHNNCEEIKEDLKIPALILQPLMENAIKYGLQGENEQVDINLHCKVQQGQLYIEFSNNFDEKTAARKGSGTGLYTVRKRLEILFAQYHLFKTEKRENLFKVLIIIPQKTYE
jgi:two-component system LytT family sensor kinase